MALFYLPAFFILFYGAHYQKCGFYSDCLGIEQANAIKGFFILMVFIGHSIQTIGNLGYPFVKGIDILGKRIWSEFGQLIVVMFLFYSGYGVMESFQKKGQEYLRSFPQKRVLTTLLNFDIAVLLFVVLDLALGVELSLKQIGLSFLAWKSVGNSNWYIFIILFCYITAYLGLRLSPYNNDKSSFLIFILALLGMLALSFKKPAWWYDTLLCFSAGVFFSVYKDRISRFFHKNYYVVLLASMGLFLLFHFMSLPDLRGLTHNFESVLFAIITVLFTMKVKTGNAVLMWLGMNVFPIYIYQRIPMIAIGNLAGGDFVCNYPYVFVFVCSIATLIIAWGYQYWKVKLS